MYNFYKEEYLLLNLINSQWTLENSKNNNVNKCCQSTEK